MFAKKCRLGEAVPGIAVWVIGILCAFGTVDAQEPAATSGGVTDEKIKVWIGQLESDSYAARQMAFQLLQQHPDRAIPLVEAAIDEIDDDAAGRLIRLLGRWSDHPDFGYGREAFELLRRLSEEGVTARASKAQNTMQAIMDEQSLRATERLRDLSAYLNFEENKLFLMNRLRREIVYVLRIDDAFRGSVDDLKCLRWLSDVEVVRVIGPTIDRNILEKIATIPNLRMLQIRNTSLTSQDLIALTQVERLDGLEILYSPIDDQAVDILGSLPLWGRLRLFGTQMSLEGAEALRERLDGSDVTFGLGGFLGVSSKDPNTLVLDDVTRGGGAEKAGLMAQDRILTLNGKKLERFDELRAELAKHPPGAVVTIEFERIELTDSSEVRKTVRSVEVTLGEQAESL